MGKAPIPTIVGGGISLVPGVVGQIGEYFFVSSIIPPEGTTSSRFRIITSTTPDQLVAETEAAREDTVIGPGSSNTGIAAGNLRPDVIIGRNISVSHGNIGANNAGIFIGSGMTSSVGSGTGNVVLVPNGLTQSGGTIINSGCVIIGGGITIQNLQNTSVIIGTTATASGNTGVVVVGDSAIATANSGVAVGQAARAGNTFNVSVGQGVSTNGSRSIAMGQGHGCPNADMIKIGHGGQNAGTAGQILIGNSINPNAVGTNEICLGNEANNFTVGLRLGHNQHTSGVAVPAYTVQWKSALGTDIAAGSVTFIAPKATGNAAAGSFIFQTSPAGASGATLQTAATRLTISPNGVVTFAAPTVAAENIVISGSGGAGQASIRLNGLTDGVGALAGTLGNSPVLGDPTFWAPISIAGVVKHFPCW